MGLCAGNTGDSSMIKTKYKCNSMVEKLRQLSECLESNYPNQEFQLTYEDSKPLEIVNATEKIVPFTIKMPTLK